MGHASTWYMIIKYESESHRCMYPTLPFHFLSWEISTLWKNLILLDIQVSPSSSYYEKQWPPFWFSRNLGQSRHGISLTLIWIMLNKQNSGHCTVTNFYLNTNSNTKSKISLFNKSLYLFYKYILSYHIRYYLLHWLQSISG